MSTPNQILSRQNNIRLDTLKDTAVFQKKVGDCLCWNGNKWVALTTVGSAGKLVDKDGDTQVCVEKTADADCVYVQACNGVKCTSGQLFADSLSPDATDSAKCSKYTLKGTTTANTQTEIFIDPATQKRLTIPDQTSWVFCITVLARGVETGGIGPGQVDHLNWGWKVEGIIARDDSNSTFILEQNMPTLINTPTGSIDLSAENNALVIKVTPVANSTVRWVACVDTVECQYTRQNEVSEM